MSAPDTQRDDDTSPLDRVERAQSKVAELRGLLERLLAANESQQAALSRLAEARSGRLPAEEMDKAIRQMVASLMLFEGLATAISDSFGAFEQPMVALMHEVSAKLHDREQLAALSNTAQSLNSSLEFEQVLEQAMSLLVSLTGGERALLLLPGGDDQEMTVRARHNLDQSQVEDDDFAVSRSIVEQVQRTRRAIVTTNAAMDPRFNEVESVALNRLRSIICVPLLIKDAVRGVVYVDNRIRTDTFTDTDRDFVSAFAAQVAIALENASLFESVSMARNMMNDVFESIPNAIIASDERGRISLVNASAERILGNTVDALIGRGYARLAPYLDGTLSLLFDEVFDYRAPAHRDLVEGRLPDGREVCLSASAAPLMHADGESAGAVMVVVDHTESMQFARERDLVRRYLPPQLVDSFALGREHDLGGARHATSILFADLRGFTRFSAERDPAEVVDVLNGCFGAASNAIRGHGGIVDKYMGDAVMAHYNSPLHPQEDHAWLAVKTAWELREALAEQRAARPLAQSLRFGIGISTGNVLAGNIGSPERMEYTVIGEPVNLARRLQEVAAPDQILIAASTRDALGERIRIAQLEPQTLKGMGQSHAVFEVLGLN